MLLQLRQEAGIPPFDVGRGAALEQGDKGVERFARVAEGIVEGVPVFAVLAVVVRDYVFEMVGEAKFGVRAARAALDILQILDREFTLLSPCAAEELAAHHVRHEIFEIDIAAGSVEKGDFFGRKRREKSGQAREMRERWMSENRAADHGIAFEEDVALRRKLLKIWQVEGLQVAANVEDRVPVVIAERFDVSARAEMVVDPVAFAGARVAAVEEDEWLKASKEVRMEFSEGFGQRTFAGTRGTRKNNESA